MFSGKMILKNKRLKQLAFLLAAVTIVGACSPSKQRSEGSASNGIYSGEASVPASSPIRPTTGLGTGDGGGANYCKGAPLDSYEFKVIEKSAAYKKHVAPILSELEKNESDISRIVLHGLKKKLWLLMPCELKTLDKNRIASKVETDQGVLQDFKEVWLAQYQFSGQKKIDEENAKPVHLRRSKQELVEEIEHEQAYTIMHELLMAVRLLKLDSSKNECLAFAPAAEYCDANAETLRGRPLDLNDKDYQDIRRATTQALQMPVDKRSPDDWENLLAANGFEIAQRTFMRVEEKKEISPKEYLRLLNSAILSKNLPTYGYTADAYDTLLKSVGTCTVSFEISDDQKSMVAKLKMHDGKSIERVMIINHSAVQSVRNVNRKELAWQGTFIFEAPNQWTAKAGERIFSLRIDMSIFGEINEVEIGEDVCTEYGDRGDGLKTCKAKAQPSDEFRYHCAKTPTLSH